MINEIRLGNFAKVIVAGVVTDRKRITLEDLVRQHTNKDVTFEPIRLNDQRLADLGFLTDGMAFWKSGANGRKLTIGNYKNGYYYMVGNQPGIQVQSVHHIQNLFFDTVGEEVI